MAKKRNFRPTLNRCLLVGVSALLLNGCRLVVSNDGAGYILSESGNLSCHQASCTFPIETLLTDRLLAIPQDGYRFVQWHGLCENSPTSSCEIILAPVPNLPADSPADVILRAEFETLSTPRAWYRDRDGDDFGDAANSLFSNSPPADYVINSLDCDDTDSSVRPFRKEIEDQRDNNCNGTIDEGFRYYLDSDGDKHGDPRVFLVTRKRPDGYVRNSRDCDDSDPTISPLASESLDNLDNDCDGHIDEDFRLQTFYYDVDQDGLGDATATTEALEAPPGYASKGGDNCPDVRNPSQTDTDGDGIGDLCDQIDNSSSGGAAGNNSDDEQASGGSTSGSGSSCSISAEAQAMLDAVNQFRAASRDCGSEGVFPSAAALAWDCKLEATALGHSQDMADNNYFSHTGLDGSKPWERASRAGYSWSAIGENIAAGYSSVSAVMQGWIDSDGHCANLMGSQFIHLGAARASNASSAYYTYWTQVFGRP